MFVHVPADLAQETVIDRLVRGIAILDLAEDRHVAIHTQQREHELLQIRALVLAVAMSDLERCCFVLGAEVVAKEVDRGRVEVNVVGGYGETLQRPHRQRRKDPLRACGKEAIEHPSDILITEVLRG
jgi:hypothetical protein